MDVFARPPAVLRRRAEQRAETEKNGRIRREKQDRMRDEVGVLLRDQARVGGRRPVLDRWRLDILCASGAWGVV